MKLNNVNKCKLKLYLPSGLDIIEEWKAERRGTGGKELVARGPEKRQGASEANHQLRKKPNPRRQQNRSCKPQGNPPATGAQRGRTTWGTLPWGKRHDWLMTND
ncbi:hypothetical protein [Scytonema sp. HK-05]|uniref:hypothetical protein n=1 Tax=Scytonema sp. HK-05 TaxID=1137095 RepID=UPI0009372A02|nr:hypothetical protein [Scytonema sp. HK-05]OKH52403.1 hypothetical protein NIES2130_32215 [Scytonema sp. HK-05]